MQHRRPVTAWIATIVGLQCCSARPVGHRPQHRQPQHLPALSAAHATLWATCCPPIQIIRASGNACRSMRPLSPKFFTPDSRVRRQSTPTVRILPVCRISSMGSTLFRGERSSR